MIDNYIQIKEKNTIILGIKDKEGNDTGEVLKFQMNDINLPLRYQELLEKDKRNKTELRNQLLIIDKRQDVKGKKLMSKNEEDKIKALNDFFKKETEVYNMFLGENGVQKLLNGRKLGWTSLQEIDEIITKQVAPYLDLNMTKITEKVKKKYGIPETKEEVEVLE